MRKRTLTEAEKDLIETSNGMIRAGRRVLADPTIPSRIKTAVNIEMLCHRECLAIFGLELSE